MIKLIIFDWDDVFTLKAKEAFFACYHKAINDVGVFLSPEEEHKRILAKWSKSFREELRELLKEHPELLDKACEIFDKEYWGGTFINTLEYVEGANELLLRLKDKYTLAISTGNDRKMVVGKVFLQFNVPNVFAQIISAQTIKDQTLTKPHPYMLETIMETQGVSPNETVFVGDAKTDVQMAYNAHVTPIVVLTGHLNKKGAEELKVKYIIKNVTLLENVLNSFH